MAISASDRTRKILTFCLAVFLWLHAVIFLNPQSDVLASLSRFLSLTFSETVLLIMLATLSLISGAGFWRTVKSAIYIYCFPFVLLWYCLVALFILLKSVNAWLNAQRGTQPASQTIEAVPLNRVSPAAPVTTPQAPKKRPRPAWRYFLRPFEKFTVLWCILLAVATHRPILWLCLIVVLAQLARQILFVLKFLFFSNVWWQKYLPFLFAGLKKSLETLDAVTPDIEITNELKSLFGQLNFWQKILNFLKDSYLVSRWGALLVAAALMVVYSYFAVLFSFCYHTIALLEGVAYSWSDALVTSVFMPFFIDDLPKHPFAIRVLGGIHGALVVAIGVGAIVNFFRRKLDDIRKSAEEMSNALADQNVREKYQILEKRIKEPSGN